MTAKANRQTKTVIDEGKLKDFVTSTLGEEKSKQAKGRSSG